MIFKEEKHNNTIFGFWVFVWLVDKMRLLEDIVEKKRRKSVFKDRDAISIHFVPERLPFRERQLREILEEVSELALDKKANNLFLYGKIGTGKTAVAKKVLRELREFAEKNRLRISGKYINCKNYNTKYKVICRVAEEFYPSKRFFGFSSSYVFEKILDFLNKNGTKLVVVLDEIDKVKDVDDLLYKLTRANSDVEKGGIYVIGVSNNLLFKNRLNMQTKSSLCEREFVFPPYNAHELEKILLERVGLGFREGVVGGDVIRYISALAAQESGDARRALILLQKTGEVAEESSLHEITIDVVKNAKERMEVELISSMIATLPKQHKLVLYSISMLNIKGSGIKGISGEKRVLTSGEIYDYYRNLAKELSLNVVSLRQFKEYLNELNLYNLIETRASGAGFRGTTTLTSIAFNAFQIKEILDKEFFDF